MVSTFIRPSEITQNESPLENAQATVQKTAKGTAKEIAREAISEIARQMSQECVARRLRQVNRTITRLYDEALRPHGLTVNQLNILAVIISEKQIRPGQLGQTLGMEKSTVSRTVDRMARKDWLKVQPGEDSRTQLLTVTPKGRKLLLSVTPVWDQLQAGVLTDAASGTNILQMLALDCERDAANSEIANSEAVVPSISSEDPVSAEDFYL